MKNAITICLTVLSLIGCTKTPPLSEPNMQNAEQFAQELEASKDPVKVMDAYITYFQSDIKYYHNMGNIVFYGIEIAGIDPLGNNIAKGGIIAQALAEPGTKWRCISDDQSDECILYRRNRHETKVAYFDYKRFLGNNTRVKDDNDFLKLARIYSNATKCETLKEATSLEKQACKDRREKALRLAVKQKVHCKDLVEIEYKEELAARHRSYQLNVDVWRYSHSAAMQDISKDIHSFADEYMCNISGWERDMFK